MKKSLLNPMRMLPAMLILFFAACSSDDGDKLSTAEKLTGTWTTSAINVEASVGDQSLTDYLTDEIGLSAEDAASYYALLVAALQSEVSGSLTLNADNTYESDFGDEGGSGTWSLSADEKTLTLTDASEVTEIAIDSVSGSTLKVTYGDDISMDLDDEPGTPDEEVSVEAHITLTK